MVDELTVRQIRLERIWTAAGWPRSAQREGVRPRMGRAIPMTPRRLVLDPKRRFAYLAERRWWTTPLVTRHILCLALRAIGCADVRSGIPPPQSTNSSGTNLDSRRLAPQRAARRGEAQDGPSNPHDSTPPRADPKRRFAYLAERRWWTNQRLLGTSCASHSGPSAAPMFAPASCLHRRQIRLERIWTAAGWPRSAQREGVRPRMARAIPLTPRRLVLDRRAFCVSGGAD